MQPLIWSICCRDVQNRLFACLEVGNNLSSYNAVFSMKMSRFYTIRTDDAWLVNEMHAVMVQVRLIVRLFLYSIIVIIDSLIIID